MKNFLDKIVEEFEQFPQVCAISRCGSSRAKTNDALSDIDLEIFTDGEIPINKRLEIVKNTLQNTKSAEIISADAMSFGLMK